jgi:hypothetical protein
VTGYADPEVLIQTWLHEQTAAKTWADPRLPGNWSFTAPLVHVQRGQDFGDERLSLDIALIDIDVYGKDPDHTRALAEQVRGLMRLALPLHTFDSGVFVKAVFTVMAPTWLPYRDPGGSTRQAIDPNIARRGSTYRVVLHGMVA